MLEGSTLNDDISLLRQVKLNRLKHKRQQRKKKLAQGKYESVINQELQSSEDKKKIRKMRNRDAAQRARDKAKKKMEELHSQVQMLRIENELLKKQLVVICKNCQQKSIVKEENSQPFMVQCKNEKLFSPEPEQKLQKRCGFQRVPNLPNFQYPFYFGLLTILACFVLVCYCPMQQGTSSQMRILESLLQNNWKQSSLKRQQSETIVLSSEQVFSAPTQRIQFSYSNNIYFFKPNRKQSSKTFFIQIEESSNISREEIIQEQSQDNGMLAIY